jgi:hypothetical protein
MGSTTVVNLAYQKLQGFLGNLLCNAARPLDCGESVDSRSAADRIAAHSIQRHRVPLAYTDCPGGEAIDPMPAESPRTSSTVN